MSKLLTLNGLDDQEILNKLFDTEITVFEDIQGSKIWVDWNGSEFTFRPKSISNEPINLIDLTIQNYYNSVVNYFNSLDNRVKSLLNKKWTFGFEYFPDNQPAHILYDRTPKNNLVLTAINKNGDYNYSIEELDEYSRLFNVDIIPIIYHGKLTDRMIEAIKYFINTSEEDLEYVFGEKSFSFFFYKILNPNISNSFLMDENEYQNNIEKLIIRTSKDDLSFEILNPLYKRLSDNNSTEFIEVYTLILVNFLNFCQSLNLGEIKLKGDRKDELYIYLISKLFNIYVSEVKEDLLNFDFIVPEFFDKEKFQINKELIPNKLTKDYINDSKKLEYIYKIILGSFNKKRKKPIGVFTENTVILFNNFINDINVYIDNYMNKIHEIELNRSGLLDFSDFFDVKYDVDAENNVYPDIYTEFEKGNINSKKKGKERFAYMSRTHSTNFKIKQ
jgi:hypothetical protein